MNPEQIRCDDFNTTALLRMFVSPAVLCALALAAALAV
jgi:hypothetical protein